MSKRIPLYGWSLVAGVVFGFGLALGQMTNPEKVKDFLDFTAMTAGGWDPSLALVMGGAVIPAFLLYRFAGGLRAPWAADMFRLPFRTGLDLRLVGGSAVFGVGWGLSGLCPGPAVADLAIDFAPAVVFVGAMFAGSWLVGVLTNTGGFGAAIAGARSR